jgi:hypothetical protein
MRVFFSYSHDNEDHKDWVLSIANDLKRKGFDTILDQTHLKPGKDILHFAESAVQSSDYVLMICTPNYALKANNRTAGVGWEVSMITSELFKGADGKFIAILKDGTPEISIPNFMKTKLYIDIRESKFTKAWNELCNHMLISGDSDQIGDLLFEALFKYDKDRIYDQPRLHELKRFTQFVETGNNSEGRWYVLRKDPIKGDLATILFQE